MAALSFALVILSWCWAVYVGEDSTAWRWSALGIAAAGVMLWGFAREKARFRKRSEEHTSELQSPMYPLFPTRRSSDVYTWVKTPRRGAGPRWESQRPG